MRALPEENIIRESPLRRERPNLISIPGKPTLRLLRQAFQCVREPGVAREFCAQPFEEQQDRCEGPRHHHALLIRPRQFKGQRAGFLQRAVLAASYANRTNHSLLFEPLCRAQNLRGFPRARNEHHLPRTRPLQRLFRCEQEFRGRHCRARHLKKFCPLRRNCSREVIARAASHKQPGFFARKQLGNFGQLRALLELPRRFQPRCGLRKNFAQSVLSLGPRAEAVRCGEPAHFFATLFAYSSSLVAHVPFTRSAFAGCRQLSWKGERGRPLSLAALIESFQCRQFPGEIFLAQAKTSLRYLPIRPRFSAFALFWGFRRTFVQCEQFPQAVSLR